MYYPATPYYDQQCGEAGPAYPQQYDPPARWNSQWGPPQQQEYYYNGPPAYDMPAYNGEVASSQWGHTDFAQARPSPVDYPSSQTLESSELDLDGAPIVRDSSYTPLPVHKPHDYGSAYSSSNSHTDPYHQRFDGPRYYPSQSSSNNSPPKHRGQATHTKAQTHGNNQSDARRVKGDSSVKNSTGEEQPSPIKSPRKRKRASRARYLKKQPDWYTPSSGVKMPIEYVDLTESDSELSSITDQSVTQSPPGSPQDSQCTSTTPKQADDQSLPSTSVSTSVEQNNPANSGPGNQIGKNAGKNGEQPGIALLNPSHLNAILSVHKKFALIAQSQLTQRFVYKKRKRKRKRRRGPIANAERRERRERREMERMHGVATVANTLEQTPNNFGKRVEEGIQEQSRQISSTSNFTSSNPSLSSNVKASVSSQMNSSKPNSSSKVEVRGSQSDKRQTLNQAEVHKSETDKRETMDQAKVRESQTDKQQTLNEQPQVVLHVPSDAELPSGDVPELPVSRSKNARKRRQYQVKKRAQAQFLQIKAGKDVELDAMKNDLELY